MITRTLVALMLSVLAPDGPFADLTYEAALAKAKEQEKLLFVDFTASWCVPCKKMDADTWRNAQVGAWLAEHAIAIQVNVDAQKELAQQFGVEALPTVVALRGGQEFDRVVGYRDVSGFLAWARDVAAGNRSSDDRMKRGRDLADSEEVSAGNRSSDELMRRARDLADSEDVSARRTLARDLLGAERYSLALEHYLWLWSASRKVPEMSATRLSFIMDEMAVLANNYPPAKQAFLEILDSLQAQVDTEHLPESLVWREWSSFCGQFHEQQRIAAWYERRRDADGRLFADRSGEFIVQEINDDVLKLLFEMDRLQDAVRLMGDTRSYVKRIYESFERHRKANANLDEGLGAGLDKVSRGELTDALSRTYAALLSVGRKEEAIEVGELLIRTLDRPETRMALVNAGAKAYAALLSAGHKEEALEVGELLISTLDTVETRLALVNVGLRVAQGAEENLSGWLDEAEAAGADVKPLRRWMERLAEAKKDD